MNDILIVFGSNYISYFWLIVGLIFLFVELATPGLLFFIAFAVGSCFASAMAFLDYTFATQCVIGLIVSIISFFIIRYYFVVKDQKRVHTNVDALVGKQGVIIKRIEPLKIGRVKIKGEEWAAQVEGDVVWEVGAVVEVVRVKGNRVIVKG
jgi:inner membrane protein